MMKRSIKKKVVTVMTSAALSTCLLAGCGDAASTGTVQTDESSSSETGVAAMKLLDDGTYEVTVAVLDGMAPYTYTDENGDMQGYDYEWMVAVDEKLDKYTFKYVSVSPDAAPAAIQAGTYAMSCSAHFITPARIENFILGIPNTYYPINLVSRKEDSYTKFEDLDGKVLVPNPPNDGLSVVLSQMAAEYPNVKYTQEPTSEYIPYLDGLQDVIKGKYDCWFGGESMYNDLIAANPELAEQSFCSEPVTTASCVPVINKNLTEFREAVNQATCELYKDGTLKELSEKWLGADYFETAKETGSLFDYEGYTPDKAEWYKE